MDIIYFNKNMQEENIDFFVNRLNRLKFALGVSKDKEVASFLGLADKAFNARKARNSFPAQELLTLCEARPELKLNYDFIMEGKPQQESQDEFVNRQQLLNRMTELVQALPLSSISRVRLALDLTGDPAQDVLLIVNALRAEVPSPRTSALLADYEAADDSGKKIIEGTASLAAKSMPASPLAATAANSPKRKKKPSASTMGNNNQINSAPGAVLIKGSKNSVVSRPRK